MKTKAKQAIIATTLLLTNACATSSNFQTSEVSSTAVLSIDTSYKLTRRHEFTACTEFFGFWPLPIFFTRSTDGSEEMFGIDTYEKSMSIAINRVMIQLINSDAIIAPKTRITSSSGAIWWHKTCVNYSARGVIFTPDIDQNAKDNSN